MTNHPSAECPDSRADSPRTDGVRLFTSPPAKHAGSAGGMGERAQLALKPRSAGYSNVASNAKTRNAALNASANSIQMPAGVCARRRTCRSRVREPRYTFAARLPISASKVDRQVPCAFEVFNGLTLVLHGWFLFQHERF